MQDQGLLVVRSSNIQAEKLDLSSDLQFVNIEAPAKIVMRKGDIAICMSNGSKRLVGKSAVYQGDFGGTITVGAFCSIFRSEHVLAPFLFRTSAYNEFLHILLSGTNINNHGCPVNGKIHF